MKFVLIFSLILTSANAFAVDSYKCIVSKQGAKIGDQSDPTFFRMKDLVVQADGTLHKFTPTGKPSGRGVVIFMKPSEKFLNVDASIYNDVSKVSTPKEFLVQSKDRIRISTFAQLGVDTVSLAVVDGLWRAYVLFCEKQ